MSARLCAAALLAASAVLAARAQDPKPADDNPYRTAKVGDFATYKLKVKAGTVELDVQTTQTVTARTDKEATVKVTATVNGMEAPAQEQKVDITKPFDPTRVDKGLLPPGTEAEVKKDKDGTEKIKVGGKDYDATWTTYKVKAKSPGGDIDADVKVWVAKDVPMGLVKMTMTADVAKAKMEMSMELSESGSGKK